MSERAENPEGLVERVTRALELALAEHGLVFDPVDNIAPIGESLAAHLRQRPSPDGGGSEAWEARPYSATPECCKVCGEWRPSGMVVGPKGGPGNGFICDACLGRPAPTEPREEDGERADGAKTTKFNPRFSIFDLVEDPHCSLWDGNPEEGGSELRDHPRVPLAEDVKFEFVAGQVEVWVTNGPKGPPVVRVGDTSLTCGGDLAVHWPGLAVDLDIV